MIIYQKYEFFSDLLAYAKSQSPSAILNMYADFVDNELFNSYNTTKLKEVIPKQGAKYDTEKEKTSFIKFYQP